MKRSLIIVSIIVVLVIMSLMFVGCNKYSDAIKTKEKYVAADCTATLYNGTIEVAAVQASLEELLGIDFYDGLEYALEVSKERDTKFTNATTYDGVFFYFKSRKDAKRAVEAYKERKSGPNGSTIFNDEKVVRKGKVVYMGDDEIYDLI